MAECYTLCQQCDVPIGSSESAHQAHDTDCDRFLTGVCRCDGWLCLSCCPELDCTPLAELMQGTRADSRARAEAAEVAAHEATA